MYGFKAGIQVLLGLILATIALLKIHGTKMTSTNQQHTSSSGPIYIVSSSDDNYFFLLKGLFLSLVDSGLLDQNIVLGFVDIGCSDSAVNWLQTHNVEIRSLDQDTVGVLRDQKYGYRRAQTCRPFLPKIFPDASAIVWMDCDTWVQDVVGFLSIVRSAAQQQERIWISQEINTAYLWPGFNFQDRAFEMRDYYQDLYDEATVQSMMYYPTFNSGIFVMNALNQIWDRWQKEIVRIYVDEYESHTERTLHFAEQMSLNYLIRILGNETSFDPLYNFLCNWQPPYRSDDGIVRTRIAPNVPVGVLHLGGGWKRRGQIYLDNKLLYSNGAYLSDADWKQVHSLNGPR